MSVYDSIGMDHGKKSEAVLEKKKKRCKSRRLVQEDGRCPLSEVSASGDNRVNSATADQNIVVATALPAGRLFASNKCQKLGLLKQLLSPSDVQKVRFESQMA